MPSKGEEYSCQSEVKSPLAALLADKNIAPGPKPDNASKTSPIKI